MASSARVAVLEAVAPAPAAEAVDLTESVLLELRMALRGKPLDDVAKSLGHEVATVMRTVSTLMERGAVVRRGTRYFVA
jgi:predicted transcriptional regulator